MKSNKYKNKDSETKDIYNFSSANQNNGGNKSQLGQTSGQIKKNCCLNRKDQCGWFFNISTTGSNVTTAKKNKK